MLLGSPEPPSKDVAKQPLYRGPRKMWGAGWLPEDFESWPVGGALPPRLAPGE